MFFFIIVFLFLSFYYSTFFFTWAFGPKANFRCKITDMTVKTAESFCELEYFNLISPIIIESKR